MSYPPAPQFVASLCAASPEGVRLADDRAGSEGGPDGTAAELCAELRRHRSMTLRTIASDEPHSLLGSEQGGIVDQLRVAQVHSHAEVLDGQPQLCGLTLQRSIGRALITKDLVAPRSVTARGSQ